MDHLNLMTWNVRYFGHGSNGLRASAAWMDRIALALAALPELPDVVALQEVETQSLRAGRHELPQLERFLDRLNRALIDRDRRYRGMYFPAHRYAVGDRVPLYTTGLAVLLGDGVEVIDQECADITAVRLPFFARLKQRRIAVHLRLAAAGGQVDLVNTHLSLPAFLEVGPHRVPHRMGHGSNQLAEAGALMDFVESRRGSSAVVVGDFNSLPDSPVYRHICDLGWQDAYRETTGAGLDQMKATGTASFLHLQMHIDHVFSTGVDWHTMRVGHGFSGLSDHLPKLGSLRL